MIKEVVEKIIKDIPGNVEIVAAAKQRTPQEVLQAVCAGVKIIGDNYVQEAQKTKRALDGDLQWHFIGRLQSNKVRRAVKIFDVIQTLDSFKLARLINAESHKIGKVMPVLVEVNVAREPQKGGIFPDQVEEFIQQVLNLKNIKLIGLMMMGEWSQNSKDLRPQFKEAKNLFDKIGQLHKDKLDWKYLSMGMSESYKVAIEEGANMVRLGTAIFGQRNQK
ncbi:MAG: YggS family pyridoxal phosphate-dependent enzyme [Candidatus Omnitrophica bacterium]|nr:YggS family pyridoxal phosphate-dependent enzyme [Candidatus Omnitrophota bacterium]